MTPTVTQDAVLSDAQIGELAQQLRVDAVRAADAAGSGHPTSSMSAAELTAVLLARHLRYDFDRPDHPGNDHLILSKGHASPLLYAAYKAAGAITDDELLTFRKLGSRLEGHPTPKIPWVDVATGSLGQGLPIGVGVALAGKRLDHLPYRTWVLCGDSELAEGSVWEAFEQAGMEGLDNLTAIIDVNRLGQRGPTRHGWDLDAYARRIRAFGWYTVQVDGHDIDAVDEAMATARTNRGAPTAIIARTRKGRGVAAVEDREGKHGKPLPDAEAAVRELGGLRDLRVRVRAPQDAERPSRGGGDPDAPLPHYRVGDDVATRTAFGEALAALGSLRGDVVTLDGEVGDSTKAQLFAEEHPERYFECYIAEQQLIAAAVGYGRTRLEAVRRHLRGLPDPRPRLPADGRGLPVRPQRRRVARRCLHRPGRAVPDGPGRPRHAALAPRQHRALPLRRQPDRPARHSHGRPPRHQLPAHHARRDPGDLRSRRGIPHRRQQGAALRARRPGHPHRRRASPSTRRWPRRTSWPPRGSRRGSSTSTRSSPWTRRRCGRRRR